MYFFRPANIVYLHILLTCEYCSNFQTVPGTKYDFFNYTIPHNSDAYDISILSSPWLKLSFENRAFTYPVLIFQQYVQITVTVILLFH